MSWFGNAVYRELPRSKEQLPIGIIHLAARLFAGQTGLSGPQIFAFFGRFSDDIAKMRYGSGVPTRSRMFENFLESLPAQTQMQALTELCDYRGTTNLPAPEEIEKLRSMLTGTPVPSAFGKTVKKIDSAYVTRQWTKLIERLEDDPEAAITSARTLLESVCLHILDRCKRVTDYKGDLPALYKQTIDALGVALKPADDQVLKQVLGSCSGLVTGIATLRNQFGDAHGSLEKTVHRRLAHLAANASGTICTYLVECLEARREQ